MKTNKCYWFWKNEKRQSSDCQDAIIISKEFYSLDGKNWKLDGVFYERYTSGTSKYLIRTKDENALIKNTGPTLYDDIMADDVTYEYGGWAVDNAGLLRGVWSKQDNWGNEIECMEKVIAEIEKGEFDYETLPA